MVKFISEDQQEQQPTEFSYSVYKMCIFKILNYKIRNLNYLSLYQKANSEEEKTIDFVSDK